MALAARATFRTLGLTGLLLASLLAAGCTSGPPGPSPTGTTASRSDSGGDAFDFTVPAKIVATAGTWFLYSFCEPQPATNTTACGPFPETTNPRGGQAPYHFQLGSGTGFPPFGVTLNKDGLLQGTVSDTEAGKNRTIVVCAVDVSADAVCREVTIQVKAAPVCGGNVFQGTSWNGTFDISTRYVKDFEFTFGRAIYDSWGCTVPVANATVHDSSRNWILNASGSTPPLVSAITCDKDSCYAFKLHFGLPDGPGVKELGGARELHLDAPSYGTATVDPNAMTGSAGAGGWSGDCCWGGHFQAQRR